MLQIFAANVVASAFLTVRLVYFCLAIFAAERVGSRWNPLSGSVAALVCMVLIPEFIVVLIYVYVGLTIDGSMGEDNDQNCTRRTSSKSDDETSPP